MMGLVAATELVSLFVALEIMSIALYGLTGLRRDRPESQEAALKYFVTGAFSSAFFLYGVALLYGVAGSTHLDRVVLAVSRLGPGEHGLALLWVGFLLVGFGFKVGSVPFHMWAPDVYEGAPTTVTAFMAAGVKVAAFGALLRIFGQALLPLAADWRPAVAVLAVVTMILGNLAALGQTNLKRMLAYSSIARRRPAPRSWPLSWRCPGILYLVGAASDLVASAPWRPRATATSPRRSGRTGSPPAAPPGRRPPCLISRRGYRLGRLLGSSTLFGAVSANYVSCLVRW
jgi:hypothetical protein